MRELWANGQHYRSAQAFFRAIGVEPNKKRSMQYALADALKIGEQLQFGGKSYDVSEISPLAKVKPKHEPRPDFHPYIESDHEEPRPPRGLLARGYATVGLHQDHGEHYR